MTFDDISNYSYDVAAQADSFKTLGQQEAEKVAEE
jgi:hypothetical protein